MQPLAQATTPSPTPNIQADWYTYDADGRVLIANGSLENGQIVVTSGLNSGENWYDAAGDLIQYESYQTINSKSQEIEQQSFYNQLGQQVLLQTETSSGSTYANDQTDTYDADGHLISQVTYQLPGSVEAGTYNGNTVSFSDAGWVKSDVINTYNADGELIDQSTYAEDSAQNLINEYGTGVATSAYATADQSAPGLPSSVGASTDGSLYLATEDAYSASSAGYGYDADGNLLGYKVITSGQGTVLNPNATASTDSFQNSYIWQNAALNSQTVETATSGTQTNTNTYNDLGNLVGISGGVNGTSQTIYMAYSADDQILQKTVTPSGQGSNTAIFMYTNQQGVGSVNTDGAINVLATTGGFTNGSLGTQNYTVQTGSTWASIAQSLYGDGNYGYLIAEANGMPVSSQPPAGMVLKIPQVSTTSNSATTFQPYEQSAVANANASSCETAAQLVAASIDSVLNQQSAFAQTVSNIESEQQTYDQELQQEQSEITAIKQAQASLQKLLSVEIPIEAAATYQQIRFASKMQGGDGDDDFSGGAGDFHPVDDDDSDDIDGEGDSFADYNLAAQVNAELNSGALAASNAAIASLANYLGGVSGILSGLLPDSSGSGNSGATGSSGGGGDGGDDSDDFNLLPWSPDSTTGLDLDIEDQSNDLNSLNADIGQLGQDYSSNASSLSEIGTISSPAQISTPPSISLPDSYLQGVVNNSANSYLFANASGNSSSLSSYLGGNQTLLDSGSVLNGPSAGLTDGASADSSFNVAGGVPLSGGYASYGLSSNLATLNFQAWGGVPGGIGPQIQDDSGDNETYGLNSSLALLNAQIWGAADVTNLPTVQVTATRDENGNQVNAGEDALRDQTYNALAQWAYEYNQAAPSTNATLGQLNQYYTAMAHLDPMPLQHESNAQLAAESNAIYQQASANAAAQAQSDAKMWAQIDANQQADGRDVGLFFVGTAASGALAPVIGSALAYIGATSPTTASILTGVLIGSGATEGGINVYQGLKTGNNYQVVMGGLTLAGTALAAGGAFFGGSGAAVETGNVTGAVGENVTFTNDPVSLTGPAVSVADDVTITNDQLLLANSGGTISGNSGIANGQWALAGPGNPAIDSVELANSSILSDVPDTALTATQLRNTPGIVTVSGDLQPASGAWLDAATPTPIPAQVGDALAGTEFKSFDDLRSAIWENIGNNPDLTAGFSRQNIAQMQNGFAPFAPTEYLNESGAFGQSFNLHHDVPISEGGAVYDLSNLQIVSPSTHYGIHYGSGQ